MPGLRRGNRRAARFQFDDGDVHRGGRGGADEDLPARGGVPEQLRGLRQCAEVFTPADSVRDLPEWEGLRQGGYAGELPVPPARVRAVGPAILCAPERDAEVVRLLESEAL